MPRVRLDDSRTSAKRFRQDGIEDRIKDLPILFPTLLVGERFPGCLYRFPLGLIFALHPFSQFLRLLAELFVGKLLKLWLQRVDLIGNRLVLRDVAGVAVEQFAEKIR